MNVPPEIVPLNVCGSDESQEYRGPLLMVMVEPLMVPKTSVSGESLPLLLHA